MKHDGEIKYLPGIRHTGTQAFCKKVTKGRNKKKLAKASKRRNRK